MKCNSCSKALTVRKTAVNIQPKNPKCLDCWLGQKSTAAIVQHSTGHSASSSNLPMPVYDFDEIYDVATNESFEAREVGSVAFVNSKEYGVVKGEILDSDHMNGYTFYTLDVNGQAAPYIMDDELFDTEEEAEQSSVQVPLDSSSLY